ncbi:MAG: homoserine dehydrogenase [Candidatus Aminicenantes bacterium]|nr:MAG: homoserine dehydrogenase [Candidatus Aminicenantes bacterium]
MKEIPVILLGKGQVGQAFLNLLIEKRSLYQERYNLDFFLQGIFRSTGGAFWSKQRAREAFFYPDEQLESKTFWQSGLNFLDLPLEKLAPGVVVLATVSSLKTGEPGLAYLRHALAQGWHVVTADKGPLVAHFAELMTSARTSGLGLKYSACTAAALPALDVALTALAGTEIIRVEGILNGTTNYLLTRMESGLSYEEALREAQQKGIAEPDPTRDVAGWDTAVKILLLARSIFGLEMSLEDVQREGLTGISQEEVESIVQQGKALKLLGIIERQPNKFILEVKLTVLSSAHPLFYVRGAEKGICFTTDTMSQVTVIGGRSDPRGAAAAMLKDMINIFI